MRRLLLLLPMVLLFIACQKEMSFESGTSSGTAVYTLAGAGSSCTGATLGGIYTNGIALTTANTATLTVTVATIGTYSIATTAVNGMTFVAVGTFSTTGAQAITLTGSGTPTAVATTTVSVTVGTSTCTFLVPVVAAGAAATYTIGGAGGSCTGSSLSGTYSAGAVLSSGNTATVQVNVTTLGTYNISTVTINGYSFSGVGTFTTLGTQTVILTATGTPTAAGTDVFTAGASGCTLSVTVGSQVPTATNYITCKINGTAATFNVGCYATIIPVPNAGLGVTGSSSGTITNAEVLSLLSAKALGNQISTITYIDALANAWAGTTGVTTIDVSVTSQTATSAMGTFSGVIKNNNGQGSITKTITEGKFNVPIQ